MPKALRTNRTVIYFLRGLNSNIFASRLGYFIARNRWFWRNICTCLNIYDSTNLWLLESIWYIMYKFMYMLLPPYDMIDTIWLLMGTNNLVCIVCIKQWNQIIFKEEFLYITKLKLIPPVMSKVEIYVTPLFTTFWALWSFKGH